MQVGSTGAGRRHFVLQLDATWRVAFLVTVEQGDDECDKVNAFGVPAGWTDSSCHVSVKLRLLSRPITTLITVLHARGLLVEQGVLLSGLFASCLKTRGDRRRLGGGQLVELGYSAGITRRISEL